MTYTKSVARVDFEAQVDALREAIQVSHSRGCPQPAARKHVLCSVILQGSAALESYIEAVLSGWAKEVTRCGRTTDALPPPTRAFLFARPLESAYRHFIADGDEAAFLYRLGSTLGATAHNFAVNGAAIPSFAPQSLYADKKYPSIKNLQRLGVRLGFKDIFEQLNRSAKADLKLALKSFGDVRTELAHSGVPSGMNKSDVRRHISELCRFVTHLDRVLFRHVAFTTGVATWPAPASSSPPLPPA